MSLETGKNVVDSGEARLIALGESSATSAVAFHNPGYTTALLVACMQDLMALSELSLKLCVLPLF